MTDLQKDQAIYQAMLGIATELFNKAVCSSEVLRELVKDNGGVVSMKQLLANNGDLRYAFDSALRDVGNEVFHIDVDTFSCQLKGTDLFWHLDYQKSLAKIKGDTAFTYEEKIDNKYVGSVDIDFENPANAKKLENNLANDELRPILNYVCLEVNAKTGDIHFVASNGNTLGIISNNIASVYDHPDRKYNYQALFSRNDWKRICDYAKATKSAVRFEIYRRKLYLDEICKVVMEEAQDIFVAVLGERRIKSTIIRSGYPDWRRVLPKNYPDANHFRIHPEDVEKARKFIQNFKISGSWEKSREHIFVSTYKGSDRIYFDYINCDYSKTNTASFRLTRTSELTIGTCYNIDKLAKMKFRGFHFVEPGRPTLVDTDDADLMLVMPMISDVEGDYVFDVENRAVIETVDTETAMVVELQAA